MPIRLQSQMQVDARTAVHFQDVLEKYSPYETLLEISSADALNDTSLAASFQLHTASPSPSSSRLDEIQEDEDDGTTEGSAIASSVPAASAQRYGSRTRMSKRAGAGAERSMASLPHGKSPLSMSPRSTPPESPARSPAVPAPSNPLGSEKLPTPLINPELPLSREALKENIAPECATRIVDRTRPPASAGGPQTRTAATELGDKRLAAEEAPAPSVPPKTPKDLPEAEAPSLPPKTPKDLPDLPRESPEVQARKAPACSVDQASMAEYKSALRSQSMDEEPYDFSKYDALFKPKVKLAPRPVHSPEKVKRPAVARVSAMPANVRPSAKKQEPTRPRSQGQCVARAAAVASPELDMPALPPIPATPEYRPRPISRASIKSAPSHKSSGMTADKVRLMKAVELRRKQLRKSQEQTSAMPLLDIDAPDVPQLPQRSPLRERKTSSPPEMEASAHADHVMPLARVPEVEPEQEQPTTDDESHHQSSKADSGISLRYATPDSQHTDTIEGESPETTSEEKHTAAMHVPTVAGHPAALPLTTHVPPSLEPSPRSIELGQTADAMSTASITPTEKPGRSEHGSDETAMLPTIQMEHESRPLTSDGEAPIQRSASEVTIGQSGSDKSEHSFAEPPSSPKRQNSDLAKRRRGLVEPLHIDTSSGNPDDFGSDDDEFLEELHSATVHEAKPISMARSPMAAAFPGGRRPSADTLASVRSVQIARASTLTVDRTSGTSDRLSPDSSKPPFVGSSPTPPPDAMAGFTRNVSSGISKRIQELNEFSTRDSNSPSFNWQSQPITPDTSPNGLSPFEPRDRKSSRRTPPASRPSSYRRQSRNNTNQPPVATPGAEQAPVWSVQHDPVTNRNSVTVTTRITRPTTADTAEEDQVPLQKSEVLINHPREGGPIPAPIRTDAPSNGPTPALSPVVSTNSSGVHSSNSSRFGKYHQPGSPGLDDFPPPPNNQVLSTKSLTPTDENIAPKEGSRTSRFFKRMSTLTGPKKKTSPPPMASSTSLVSNEATSPLKASPVQRESLATEKSDTPPAVVVGDLNVQLPDSLLWKRRIVTIDDAGYLQFAIASAMEIHKGIAQKKFSLSSFTMPYAPDLDRQELDHSIVLEFQDGAAVQVACEDAMTQRQVLSVLKTYWKAYQAQTTQT
ncbi:uncharacterized protein MYCFIDRAFT_213945 [Pseudocercospora fijiensis CIRAD86]|uniref:GPI-anchored cell surface glycoprotein n=1 Tax=Pseudocercospora fijiensis (strain CIRAD86) TaxID=383855 RepID=M3A3J1_PSEFD|nr:uncharacterized protein MYCFIDRAFT_213945 [Pseudocercospora fijiensis CIRAD86]EME85659.1 hypothetical protein MYCFIDRAFT_213945 [Pseudocercospora fijiensis CIRAD86]